MSPAIPAGIRENRLWPQNSHRDVTVDGNGNVRALVKADSANPAASGVTARYAYDGFGKEVGVSGADADKNAFRFSTKQLESETGMNYYGFRYYAADKGRWINRDPLVEKGSYAWLSENQKKEDQLLGISVKLNSALSRVLSLPSKFSGSATPELIISRIAEFSLATLMELNDLDPRDAYGFVLNNSVFKFDINGLSESETNDQNYTCPCYIPCGSNCCIGVKFLFIPCIRCTF